MIETEAALVQMAQGGDRGAFEEIVRRTSRLVFARLYLETGDTHRCEDLLQETLLRAFRSIQGLHDPGQLRGWLLTIAQNVLTDAARRDNRQKRTAPPLASRPLAAIPGNHLPPEEEAARAEMRGQVLAVLRSLPEEYRIPLTLRYIAGADYETIETQLGLTNGALRGLLHRGLKILKTRLEPMLS
ncbi:MAG: sigma-70 family RNA polymerase sigma factor [Gemmataceae bacterium]|nr:sigma-70 family RNA polymerase sigma factor [Gemmataceae bacterium]MCI0641100.1 sigma-70 family RNA polymerase sigma factor [Gemmataceae bacterium]MCI0740131.1 sigma-70 family RNA polymerase sigma factor [Gemmataceae bacterium]